MSENSDYKKCMYSHCKHPDSKINITTDKFAEEKGRYFHVDCKHEKDTISEIIDFWYKNIDADVIFNQLVRIIDRLIYNENVDCDFLLWGLKKKAKYLNHPPGLVYVVKDKKLKQEFDFEKRLQEFKEKPVEVLKSEEPTFTYSENNGKKKFGDIFGGQ